MKTFTTAQPLTATAVITALCQSLALVALYLIQQSRHALRTACRMAQSVRQWLNTSHDFSNEEGEIHLTGWQFLGFVCAVCAVAVLLSID